MLDCCCATVVPKAFYVIHSNIFRCFLHSNLHGFDVQSYLIRYSCDIFAVCRSCLPGGGRVSKQAFKCLIISPDPRNLYGVSYGSLNLLSRSLISSGYSRIKKLRHRAHRFHIPSGQKDGIPQIMIPLKMCRNPHIQHNVCDIPLQLKVFQNRNIHV